MASNLIPTAPADSDRVRRACRQILACFVFVCVYFTGVYPGNADSNQRSHFQLLRALAERGTAEIGTEIRDLGTHTDVSVYGGRSYSDKAPGLSVAAIPGYRTLLSISTTEPRTAAIPATPAAIRKRRANEMPVRTAVASAAPAENCQAREKTE